MQDLKFDFQLSNCQIFNQWGFVDQSKTLYMSGQGNNYNSSLKERTSISFSVRAPLISIQSPWRFQPENNSAQFV